jgi:hypothetical protein
MADWWSQYNYPIIGVAFFSGALASTYAGKTRGRYSGWVYRDKEPGVSWFAVAVYYLAGVLFIGRFLLN